MGGYWKRVFLDTWKLAGATPSIISYVVVPLAVITLTALSSGWTEGLRDIRTYGFALVTFISVVFAQFVWTIALTPYRIERDRANIAEELVKELQSGTRLPDAVLRSLSESQARTEALDRQLNAISMLMEQYRRLLAACGRWADFHGSDLREDDLMLVSNFLAEQTRQMLPPVPFGPDQPIVFQIGWNEYRYILSVPMARVPDVSFPDLTAEITARVTNATKIYVDVAFWHGPSNNRAEIAPLGPAFSARLEAEL